MTKRIIAEHLYASFDLELFRKDLRAIIVQRKLFYEQVAGQVGVHPNTINHVMNYSKNPGIDIVTTLLTWAELDYQDYVLRHK